MRVALVAAIVAALSVAAAALHEDQYLSDFFVREHIGTPLSASFLPNGALIALSEANVVGLIAPDGALSWRRVLPDDERGPLALYAQDKSALSVSAAAGSGSVARLWSVERGDLVWERSFSCSSPVFLFTGRDSDGDGVSDIASVCGGSFSVLSGLTGSSIWSVPVGVSSLISLALTPSGAPAVVSAAGTTLTVAFPAAGVAPSVATATLPAPALSLASAPASAAVVVAVEGGALVSASLTASSVVTVTPVPLPEALRSPAKGLWSLRAGSSAVAASHSSAGSAVIGYKGGEVVVTDVALGAGSFACAPSADGVSRIITPVSPTNTAAFAITAGSSTTTLPLSLGRGSPVFCVSGPGARLASTFTDGSVLAWTLLPAKTAPASVLWAREEGLAAVAGVRLVPLPAPTGLLASADVPSPVAGAVGRAVRSLAAVLPPNAAAMLLSIAGADAGSAGGHAAAATAVAGYHSAAAAAAVAAAAAAAPAGVGAGKRTPVRDAFGLRQLLLVVTRKGLALGLDAASGQTLWRSNLVAKAEHVSLVGAALWGASDIALVLSIPSAGETTMSAALRLNPWTGVRLPAPLLATVGSEGSETVSSDKVPGALVLPLAATTVAAIPEHVAGAGAAAAAVAAASGVALLHAARSVLIVADLSPESAPRVVSVRHPASSETAAAAAVAGLPVPLVLTATHIAATSSGGVSPAVAAWQVSLSATSSLTLLPLWSLSLPTGSALIAAAAASPAEPVGSVSKHAGDGKPPLVKGVERELLALVTTTKTEGLELRLLRARSGASVETLRFPALAAPATLTVSDHSVFLTAHAPSRGRHELVVVDLYAPSQSTAASEPLAIVQSYALPQAPVSVVATATARGLVGKDLVVASAGGRLVHVPRGLADARRPLVASAEDKEEGLVQYATELTTPPQTWLSLNHTLPRVTTLAAAPTALESTSLVVASGLDLFARRATPSGKFDVLADDFDAPFLLLTVTAVAVATVVAWSKLRAGKLDAEWR